jgi:PHP family Zn ribbon phosphoesterase
VKLINIAQIQGLREILDNILAKLNNLPTSSESNSESNTMQKVKFVETLYAKNWQDSKYTITNTSIKSDSDIFMTCNDGTSPQVYKMFGEACIACYEQKDNSLILISHGITPEQDVNVQFLII